MTAMVWIVGGGILQTYMIREAHGLGLRVLCTDGNPDAPGRALADVFHMVDTYDMAGHAHLATELLLARTPIVGVVTCGADVAPAVSAAAGVLGVPHLPLSTALTTHNKLLVRQRLQDAGLEQYQPAWWTWSTMLGDTQQWNPHGLKYPLVVKPLTQRASRGVTIVFRAEEFEMAASRALVYGENFLIEDCLRGSEHSAEAIFDGQGHMVWFNIVDRMFRYEDGYAIEEGHINPTRLHGNIYQQIRIMVERCAQALGVTWGPFKIDVLVTQDGEPKVLECTARLSGGFDSQWTSPHAVGHPMRALLQLACDLPCEYPYISQECSAMCVAIFPKKTGMIGFLPTLYAACPVVSPDTDALVWCKAPGEMTGPVTHNAERLGFILTTHADAAVGWWFGKDIARILAQQVKVIDTVA